MNNADIWGSGISDRISCLEALEEESYAIFEDVAFIASS